MVRIFKKYIFLTAISGSILFFGFSRAQETLFPQGSNIDVSYYLYQTGFGDHPVFKVYRTVVNNENYNLSGLYFSENLPASLRARAFPLILAGDSIASYFSGPIPNQIFLGYDTYRWVIDFPGDYGNVNNVVRPGQRLTLQYEFSGPAGNYVLPFHSVCFYGGDNGFFTIADTISIPLIPHEIPTLDEWGVMILALLILAGATVGFVRRRSSRLIISN